MPIGAQGHFGFRKESSFASGGTIDYWIPIISESVNITNNNIYSDKVAATAEQVDGSSGNISVAGDVSIPVTPKIPAALFTCAIGQSSSPFYCERPLTSLMCEVDRETQTYQVSGCTVESFSLSSSQGGELTASLSIQAAGMSPKTVGSPSYNSNNAPYVHSEATFKLNGTSDTSVTAWNIAVNNNLSTDLFGTNKQRIDIPAGKFVVTGSFTKLFDDTTERTAFLNNSERSFYVRFSRGSNYLTVYCPKVKYNSAPSNIGGQSEYIMETFEFTAYTTDYATTQSLRVSGDFS